MKMGERVKDLTGQRFGRLLVLEYAGKTWYGKSKWRCKCDCGEVKDVDVSSLNRGYTQSCGCLQKEGISKRNSTHQMTYSKAYNSWQCMRSRCQRPNDKEYARYGGRGITVCKRWQTFENFYADMGDPPDGATLDRRDNSKGYCKDNCRWATRQQQANNRRGNLMIAFDGRTMTLAQWARNTGINSTTIRARLNRGWTVKDSLTKPVA